MAEYIDIRLKRSVVALAEVLDYRQAATALELSEAELRNQISAAEEMLCLKIFDTEAENPILTLEGRFLVERFKEAVDRDQSARKANEHPPQEIE